MVVSLLDVRGKRLASVQGKLADYFLKLGTGTILVDVGPGGLGGLGELHQRGLPVLEAAA